EARDLELRHPEYRRRRRLGRGLQVRQRYGADAAVLEVLDGEGADGGPLGGTRRSVDGLLLLELLDRQRRSDARGQRRELHGAQARRVVAAEIETVDRKRTDVPGRTIGGDAHVFHLEM